MGVGEKNICAFLDPTQVAELMKIVMFILFYFFFLDAWKVCAIGAHRTIHTTRAKSCKTMNEKRTIRKVTTIEAPYNSTIALIVHSIFNV